MFPFNIPSYRADSCLWLKGSIGVLCDQLQGVKRPSGREQHGSEV